MSGTWQKFAWVGTGATLGVALSLAITVDAQRDVKSNIPVEELRTFSEVFARIKNDYVEPVSDKKLIEQAIGGMVSSLDPHSNFLDDQAFKELRTTTTLYPSILSSQPDRTSSAVSYAPLRSGPRPR